MQSSASIMPSWGRLESQQKKLEVICMLRKRYVPAVFSSAILVIPISLLSVSSRSYAIPAFSRQYQTSCTTCHIDFPKLNDFGKAFKDAGFKFPKDDETFLKVPAVM